ncbi:MAG: GntR family transcriptional regulator [Limnochordia bacterium]
MSDKLLTIKTDRITDLVYSRLRDGIINQTFVPGQKLSAEAVAAQLGVSRSPVHEAFVRLRSEGLVDIVPRKGTFVTELTAKDIEDTMEVRLAIETAACKTAIMTPTDGEIDQLRSDLDSAYESVMNADNIVLAVRLQGEYDMRFHSTLVAWSNNRRLIEIHKTLNTHLLIARAHMKIHRWKDRLPQEYKEHTAILNALKARDLVSMVEAVEYHVTRSKKSLVADLREYQIENRQAIESE